jgi:diaminopimelate epimerase
MRQPSCRRPRRSLRSRCVRASTPPTSASGCAASQALLPSAAIARLVRPPARFSSWQAAGNRYLLVERTDLEAPLTVDAVREACGDADGILEVVSVSGDEAEIVIWNPDGSQAEMSGNGTRIAARWLADRSAVDAVRIRVGDRVVDARARADGQIEQDLGSFAVARREVVEGVELVPVSVGNPHAVVVGDPRDIGRLGPLLETHPRFPDRTNVQVARVDSPGSVTARVWERGVGETQSSGTSAVAVAAATHDNGTVVVHFPGGDLTVRLENGRATLIGPAERIS